MASMGKRTKTKIVKKAELAEKVQEIQMRQKNWMQQREKEIQNKPRTDSAKKNGNPSPPYGLLVTSQPIKESKQPVQKLKTQHSTSAHLHKERFKSWLAAQQEHKHSGDSDPDLDSGPEVNILKVNSSRSPGFASSPESDSEKHYNEPSHHRKGYTENREYEGSKGNTSHVDRDEVISRLMSHKNFDALADSIVARVKQDISMKDMGYRGSQQMNYQENLQEGGPRTKGSNSDLSSHYCPICHKLMLSSDHSPTILVPCGHSVCQSCSDYRNSCPTCRSNVASKTCNIMLQQIIQDYHSNREKVRHKDTLYKPSTYTSEQYRDRVQKTKDNRSKVKYREDYENLKTRQDVLRSEVKSIQGHMKSLTSQIEQEERQISNVTKEEEKVKGQIRSLEEKLQMLQSHKEQYEKDREELKKQKEEGRHKLTMVQDTLLTVEIEMEKVKLLAEQ